MPTDLLTSAASGAPLLGCSRSSRGASGPCTAKPDEAVSRLEQAFGLGDLAKLTA